MRTPVLTALALLSTAACSMAEPVDASAPAAHATQPGSAVQPVGDCPVLVRFGSYASGIDEPTVEAVTAALGTDPRMGRVDVRSWGREGERDMCVSPREAADGPALVKVARDAIPTRKLNGYVEILLNGKRVYTSQTSG